MILHHITHADSSRPVDRM